jgi:beta-lactamase class A
VLADGHAADVVYAASTVKLAVLVAAARRLAAGTIELETEVPCTITFESDVPGAPPYRIDPDDVDEGLPPPGTPMAFGDVVERMIVVSSNEATNMVTDLVGLTAVRAVLADAGASATTYDAKYSDFAAVAAGARRETTAGDLARLRAAIVVGSLVAAPWNGWMLDVLRRQVDRRLTAHVPTGAVFGSKSGSVDGIRHDVAFVGEPGPDALVIAVCTRGYPVDAADRILESIGALATALAPGSPSLVTERCVPT